MFGWFKRRRAPAVGPDFRHVDSREKAEQLQRRGELHKLLLLPAAFGGEDIKPNIVHVPDFVVALKERIDVETVLPLAHEGKVHHYAAMPEYEGKSVVPIRIRIEATDPGAFTWTIAIWGSAVQPAPVEASMPVAAPPVFAPPAHPFASLDPASLVRAFIGDYEAWNSYANEVHAYDREQGMDAADAAYASLIGSYCVPGRAYQGISFGSESGHADAHEAIVGIEEGEGSCVVRTVHRKPDSGFVSDYEYHLKKTDGRWFLIELYYVDEDGKYACL